MVRFETVIDPMGEDLALIFSGLRHFNDASTGKMTALRMAMTVKEDYRLIGGLYGEVQWSWLRLYAMWIDPAYRGQGIGQTLMARLDDYARDNQLTGIYLETTSFQAHHLYRKQGYSEFAQIEDYPPGETMFFMKKAF